MDNISVNVEVLICADEEDADEVVVIEKEVVIVEVGLIAVFMEDEAEDGSDCIAGNEEEDEPKIEEAVVDTV